MKVAIQGQENSFHSIAAKKLYGDKVQLIYCETFKKVFESLQKADADKAVVAVENSLYGSINEVYDLLLKYRFWISGEVYEQIGFYLFGTKESSLSKVTDVYSQSFAIGETLDYFENNLPNAKLHEYFDTAAAAEMVAESKDPTKAAIASRAAGENLGLKILASNIETHHHNYTRFLALTPQNVFNAASDKTSITFRTKDRPGALHKALGVFADKNINLTKLESRPIVGEAWVYMYYVDFATSIETPEAKRALDELSDLASEIRILGSYKAGDTLIA
jgi:prephenate dehydratase